jgi:uncharacterized membrane protein (DUF2068 family)
MLLKPAEELRLTARAKHRSRRRDLGVWLIALFKLAKGLLLVAVGVGVHTLLHKDVAATLTHWANVLWIARESGYVQELLYKLTAIDDRKLKLAEITTFLYSALLFTEGIGLLLQKRWAEYLTVIVTASYIPFEIFAMVKHFAIATTVVLLINVAVVWYLCRRLWRAPRSHEC